jgi:CubicO group peptidase (beta-lactamase class C family)
MPGPRLAGHAIVLRRAAAGLALSWLHLACEVGDPDVAIAGDSGPHDTAGDEGAADQLPLAVRESLDACMADIVDSPAVSGAALAVVTEGETVWLQGFGTRHPDRDEPVDGDTRFRVGSVTKVMTAALAMTLVAEDALDLDAPVTDVLPPFGDPQHLDYPAALTLRQLLSHQGGLAEVSNINGPRGDDALAEAVLGEMFARVPYLVRPGTFYNYSNANYSVAGLMAERVAGVPYRTAVQDRIFGPLQMTRSTFDVEAVDADGNYAHGVVEGGVFDAQAYDNGWARPSGFAWSSVRDLARLVAFLQYGDTKVLPPLAHAELMSPQVDMQVVDGMHYGFGLVHSSFLAVADGRLEYESIEHSGSLPGYSALVHIVPELDLGLVFLAAGTDVDFHPCVEAAVDEHPDFVAERNPMDLEIDRTDFDAYVGEYVESAVPTVGNFSIARAESGGLRISFPTLDRSGTPYVPQLIPASRDNFHLIVDGFSVLMTGIFDDAGNLDYLRTRHYVARPLVE